MKPRVTEKQWLEATTIHELHLFWTAWKQYRQWRLFGVACCRRAMALTPDQRFDKLAESAEKFADGVMNWGAVKVVRKFMPSFRRELGDEFGPNEVKYATLDALDRATRLKPYDALGAVHEARHPFAARVRKDPERNFTSAEWDNARDAEESEQMALARDIFGNPFRPVSFSPDWRTSTVVSLANTMYDSRDFAPMPLLADALQDAVANTRTSSPTAVMQAARTSADAGSSIWCWRRVDHRPGGSGTSNLRQMPRARGFLMVR